MWVFRSNTVQIITAFLNKNQVTYNTFTLMCKIDASREVTPCEKLDLHECTEHGVNSISAWRWNVEDGKVALEPVWNVVLSTAWDVHGCHKPAICVVCQWMSTCGVGAFPRAR